MRRSDPVENLNSHIMIHGGVDRHERLLDVAWIRDVVASAKEVVSQAEISRQSPRFHQALDDLKEALNESARY